jgi:hypothetical protein
MPPNLIEKNSSKLILLKHESVPSWYWQSAETWRMKTVLVLAVVVAGSTSFATAENQRQAVLLLEDVSCTSPSDPAINLMLQ